MDRTTSPHAAVADLGAADLIAWLSRFGELISENQQVLSDLDASTGDADHGSNMERGFAHISAVMGTWDSGMTPGALLKQIGLHTVNTVGGSSGALYGTVFLRLARVVGNADPIDAPLLVAGFREAEQGVRERGKVQLGDKTMLDALAPAVDALRYEVERGTALRPAFQAAACAAEGGRDATTNMTARRGKSSYARERSRGFVDPGAASMALLVRAAAITAPGPDC